MVNSPHPFWVLFLILSCIKFTEYFSKPKFATKHRKVLNFTQSVVSNFLREVQFRIFTTILILLSFAGFIASFDLFIKIYAFTYPGIAVSLFVYLLAGKKIHFTLATNN